MIIADVIVGGGLVGLLILIVIIVLIFRLL